MNLVFYTKISKDCSLLCRNLSVQLFSSSTPDTLYKRLSPLGDPKISILPVIDQWMQEGNTVDKPELQRMIKEMMKFKRFKHALEISQWMSDKMCIPPTPVDVSARMNLIFKVHGLKQVENYYNNVSKKLKRVQVYIALLNCYAHEKSAEKAEALMQMMKDKKLIRTPLCYNILMNMYYKTGNFDKLDSLMLEMEQNGVHHDQFTLCIRLNAYAAATDIEGIDTTVKRMESDPHVVMDWNAYAIAATVYLKVELNDKTNTMLKKLEATLNTKCNNNINNGYDVLLRLVADTGNKVELHRIWNLYNANRTIYNKGYISMISSLLKLDDIEGAEEIFKIWESRKLSYDFRVPELLINVYCEKGFLEKAVFLTSHAVEKGGMPSVDVYYSLTCMYLAENRIPKAIEFIEKTISVCPSGWKPSKETLEMWLGCLEGKGDGEKVEEFLKSVENEGVFSAASLEGLRNHISGLGIKADVLV